MPKAEDDAIKEITKKKLERLLKEDLGWSSAWDKEIKDSLAGKWNEDWFQLIIQDQFEKFVKKTFKKEDYDKDTFIELGAKAYLEERGFRVNKKPK